MDKRKKSKDIYKDFKRICQKGNVMINMSFMIFLNQISLKWNYRILWRITETLKQQIRVIDIFIITVEITESETKRFPNDSQSA